MSVPVVWAPEADADLKEALAWYEGINPDLGVRFLMALLTRSVDIGFYLRRFSPLEAVEDLDNSLHLQFMTLPPYDEPVSMPPLSPIL